ncbi:hypothetical protein [Vibrio alfacsensis]|uniref:hypothetical protein n=1 Tax=Vibrio alfacsensis TaxID=1074311 RepID=UPI00406763F5
MMFLNRFALFLFASLLLTGCPSDSTDADNIAPEIQLQTGKSEYQEGEVISLSASASDEDSDDLQVSWAILDAPSQVTLEKISDLETQLIITAPLEQDVVVTVQVTVSDGVSEFSQQIQVPIYQNLLPKISYDADVYGFQLGEELSFPVTVSDSDSDDLDISWTLKGSPEGYGISSGDGVAQLTAPSSITERVDLTAVLQVSDGYNVLTKEFAVSITPNFAPLITAEAHSYTFQLGETLSFPVTVSDSDSDDLDISWTLNNSPEGYGISSSDGVVQLTAPSFIAERVDLTAVLQVSDGYNVLTKEFSVTVQPKDIIEVSLIFPPANALTDASSTVVRGQSSAELASLVINGQPVTSSDNFLTWTATLPIGQFETLALLPEATAKVTQVVEYQNFSRTVKNAKPFILENESLTASGDHVYLINDSIKQIVRQNVVTDERRIIFQATADFDFAPDHAIVDEMNNRLLVAGSLDTDVEYYGLTIVAFDLTSFEPTILFKDLQSEAFESIAFNGDSNKLLLPDWHSDGAIFEIDLITGVKTQLYNAKADFGIRLGRGYELQYHKGALLWADIDSPKLYKIDQTTDQMSLIWQQSDFQAEIEQLGLNLRFFEDFIFDEEANTLTLILDYGVVTFNLTSLTIESYVEFASHIPAFQEVETAHIVDRVVHIWDDSAQMLFSYNIDSHEYVASGNEDINIGLPRYPRSIALSNDEKSIYFSSDDQPDMYKFAVDAKGDSEVETVFDLSINNATDGQPNFYFNQYVYIKADESGFYMNKPYSDDGLYSFDFDSLNIEEIVPIAEVGSQLAINDEANLAYTLSDDTYHDGEGWVYEIIWKAIDLATGEATDISTNLDYQGTEFEYRNIDALTMTADGATLIVGVDDNLLKIATSDGALSWLSKDKLMPNLSYNDIQSLIWADGELIAINANANSGLYKVDLVTGEFTEISGKFAGSGATPFDFDSGVYSSASQLFFVIDYDLEAIYAVDNVTGARLIIHK